MDRVLVVADPHEPACHPDYKAWCKTNYRKYKCNRVVIIGDLADSQAISFHAKNPEMPGAIEEYYKTMEGIAAWKSLFPKSAPVDVTIGNHDERAYRVAADKGIPRMYLKDYKSLYDTPDWNWVKDVVIDNVWYTHGVGAGGLMPAFNMAKARSHSVVCGHHHSVAGIQWLAGPGGHKIFGMNVGCGIDPDHPAASYGADHLKKQVVACAVVVDGYPYLELLR